jgi:hypothetical protein
MYKFPSTLRQRFGSLVSGPKGSRCEILGLGVFALARLEGYGHGLDCLFKVDCSDAAPVPPDDTLLGVDARREVGLVQDDDPLLCPRGEPSLGLAIPTGRVPEQGFKVQGLRFAV